MNGNEKQHIKQYGSWSVNICNIRVLKRVCSMGKPVESPSKEDMVYHDTSKYSIASTILFTICVENLTKTCDGSSQRVWISKVLYHHKI